MHTRKIPLSDDVKCNRDCAGHAGILRELTLANLVNEAALNAARYSRKSCR